MVQIMNNAEVESVLNDCYDDLQRVKAIIDSLGGSSNIVPYLNNYAIIKACGIMEVAFKTIIADYCSKRSKKQVQEYLTRKVRDNSMNPSYENICRTLGDFDSDWKKQFKDDVNTHTQKDIILTSMKSLVAARNSFAHGGNPGLSINDTITYFTNFRVAIELLDTIVS